MSKRHVHPVAILANLGQVLYLVIIPVLRGALLAFQGDLARWLQGAWLDLAVFAVMISAAVWRWWLVTYTVTEREFILDTGWLRRKRIRVPWERVTTLSVIGSFYLRPFRAAKLRADTLGGSAGEQDFSILVSKRDAEGVLTLRNRPGEGEPQRYVPGTGSILALSLLTSNSLSGVVFLATLVSQSGRLLGREFSRMLAAAFHDAALALAFGLPPAAAAMAYVLLTGWLLAFFLTFLRYKNFEARRGEGAIEISGGVLTGREYRIRLSDVNFLEIRQSMTTRILRLYSLYISAVGYGKQKDDISCVIPTEDSRDFALARDRLFPGFSPAPRQIFPSGGAILRFLSNPLLFIGAVALATVLFCRFFPDWKGFILFVGLMSLVPAILYLVINLMDFFSTGVTKSGDYYTLRYSRGFYLHTVVIPADKIVEFRIRRSVVQQLTDSCDLILFTRAEGRVAHRCRSLPLKDAEALLRL